MDYIELNPHRRILKPTPPHQPSIKSELAICKTIINHQLKPYGLQALNQYHQISDRFIQLEVKFIQENKRKRKIMEINKSLDCSINEEVLNQIYTNKQKLNFVKETNQNIITKTNDKNTSIKKDSIHLQKLKEQEDKLMHKISALREENKANNSKIQSINCKTAILALQNIKLNNMKMKQKMNELCNLKKELANKINCMNQKYQQMEINNQKLLQQLKVKDEKQIQLVQNLSLQKVQTNRLTIEVQEQKAEQNKLLSALKEKQEKKEQMAGYRERSKVKQSLRQIYEQFNKQNESICQQFAKIEDLMLMQIEHASKFVQIK